MSRTLPGIVAGVIAAGCLFAIAWSLGWVQVGAHTTPPMASMSQSGMDHSQMAEEPDPQGEMDHSQMDHDAAAEGGMAPPAEGEAADAMDMEGEMAAPADSAPTGDMPAGAVMIDPTRQQLIGVRTAPVVREPVTRTIRTVGEVEYDERLVAHIHTKVSGWIERLYVDFTGKLVEKGQPLLEIYSPELVSTQEEYLLALRAQRTLGQSSFRDVADTSRSLLEATRRRLELWDISDEQIARLEERQTPERTLPLESPIAGYVIHKAAYEGQYVGPSTELFTIADLSRVWVTADIYENEIPYVREGQPATVTLSYLPGRTFRGRVDYVYPYLEGETRTANVRVVLSNQDAVLKPDMFANVQLQANLGESLLVPEDAVIDTGARQVVLLALEGGHFQPRDVQTGVRVDDRIQILSGLEEGETVVSGAAFLIDSESKLRSALRGMTGHHH